MKLLLLAAFVHVTLCIPDIARMKREAEANNGQIWALLAAGSSGWENYRHQSDVCHAYHVLHSHGVPDDHIVVMVYDDIAYNEMNPDPGVIINHPRGKNVYKNTPKDYTADDVTPENFLSVLRGEDMNGVGSGKTIKSSSNDTVFIYYTDHGDTGVVCFPNEMELHAIDLNKALKEMHSKKAYKQLVAYIEACHSGSMFENILPNDTNVYAMTAANPNEASYAIYPSARLGVALGDAFSVHWMENSDESNIQKETMEEQYQIVKKETTRSHVMQYGNISIADQPVGHFQGMQQPNASLEKGFVKDYQDYQQTESIQVKQGDVRMYSLMDRYKRCKDEVEKEITLKAIDAIIQARHDLDVLLSNIVKEVVPLSKVTDVMYGLYVSPTLEQWQCHKDVMESYRCSCKEPEAAWGNLANWTPSAVFVNLCQAELETNAIIDGIESVCEAK